MPFIFATGIYWRWLTDVGGGNLTRSRKIAQKRGPADKKSLHTSDTEWHAYSNTFFETLMWYPVSKFSLEISWLLEIPPMTFSMTCIEVAQRNLSVCWPFSIDTEAAAPSEKEDFAACPLHDDAKKWFGNFACYT